MPRFLNDLSFTWMLPYNPEVNLSGMWWTNSLSHPHPQWMSMSIHSNPIWYSPWGIQQMLNDWRAKAKQSAPPAITTDKTTGVVSVRDLLLDGDVRYLAVAEKLAIQEDLDRYVMALSDMVQATYTDISTHPATSLAFRGDPSALAADHVLLTDFETAFS